MRHTIVGLACSAISAVAAAAALATPLPNPPFTGGGFVAPSRDVLRQEEYVLKALNNYAKKRTTCDSIAVNSLQLAYTPVNGDKIAAVQAKWQACVQYANEYYAKFRDRALDKGTPACLDQAGIDAQQAAVTASVAAIASQVYCDGDGAAPDPVTGLNVPDKKQEAIGELELSKLALKSRLYASKCLSKGASLAQKLGGVFSPTDVDKIQACIDRATAKAAEVIAELDQTQKLPSCLTPATAEAAVADAIAFAVSSTSAIYCAE